MTWDPRIPMVVGGCSESATKTVFVDANRTDDYVPNGNIIHPYKTSSAAIAAATGKLLIYFSPGTYTGNLVIPDGISIIGASPGAVTLAGNVSTTGSGRSLLRNIIFGGTLAITGNQILENCINLGAVTISGGVNDYLMAKDWLVNPLTGVVAISQGSLGTVVIDAGVIVSQGNYAALLQTAGRVIFVSSKGQGSRAAGAIIQSTSGVMVIINSYAINAGGGEAVNLNNGALLEPNGIDGLIAQGNVTCGTAVTVVEGIVTTGTLTGAAIVHRPTSRIANDSSVTGATAKLALEHLDSQKLEKNGISGIFVTADVPAKTVTVTDGQVVSVV